MTAPPRASGGLLAALGLFTVLPVPAGARAPGPGVLAWLPVVGLALAGVAGLPALAVWRGGTDGSPLLAGVLVVVALALLTRGLHLDGAADLADGLGSRRPAEQALAVMRRPDVGAFGVAAVSGTLLLQAAALGTLLAASSRPAGLVGLAVAAATGRVAVLQAARAGIPAASGSSLGALVAGTASAGLRWTVTALLLVSAGGATWLAGGTAGRVVWSAAAVVAGLVVAELLARHAVRRLGGVSGDVFGALVEVGTTGCLLVLAAETAWR
jgi:adenosylcobinamide-GDP ribazoletransferase